MKGRIWGGRERMGRRSRCGAAVPAASNEVQAGHRQHNPSVACAFLLKYLTRLRATRQNPRLNREVVGEGNARN